MKSSERFTPLWFTVMNLVGVIAIVWMVHSFAGPAPPKAVPYSEFLDERSRSALVSQKPDIG
jgi:hypothetical protein